MPFPRRTLREELARLERLQRMWAGKRLFL